MVVFKILCIMLLNIDICNVWTKQNQAVAQISNEIHEDDVEDIVQYISLGNVSDPIELNNIARKVKRYENLQPHLQNLNSYQWKLLKDALNDYVIGNITESKLGDLLLTILLPDDLPNEKDKMKQICKSCSKSKTMFKNESYLDGDDSFGEGLEECTNTYMNHEDTAGLISRTKQMYSTESYLNDSEHDKSLSNNWELVINDTAKEFSQGDKSVNCTIKDVAVPLIIDLIKTYKDEKLADTASLQYNVSSLTNNGLISKKTLKIVEESRDLIDILTLLTLIANMTHVLKPKPVLRDSGTAPLCPYTMMSYGTSPSYTKPFHEYFDRNKSGDLVTMCYVCGLEEKNIPDNTLCEDAFSRDDFSLQAYTYKFKKYCRYDEYIHNYCVHTRDKRSVWGHWTGGCSMRKIDISGVYTQRTCRNREWPTRGHNFASHRMARLEYALDDVDDGCTVSPGASLVPFSRSISLFARFIACVCPDELCNSSVSFLNFSYFTFSSLLLIPFTIKACI